jgi:hypothetical protein
VSVRIVSVVIATRDLHRRRMRYEDSGEEKHAGDADEEPEQKGDTESESQRAPKARIERRADEIRIEHRVGPETPGLSRQGDGTINRLYALAI